MELLLESYEQAEEIDTSRAEDALKRADERKLSEEIDSTREFESMRVDQLKIVMELISPEQKMILLLKYEDNLTIKELSIIYKTSLFNLLISNILFNFFLSSIVYNFIFEQGQNSFLEYFEIYFL